MRPPPASNTASRVASRASSGTNQTSLTLLIPISCSDLFLDRRHAVGRVSRVRRPDRLDEEHVRLVLRPRDVLDAAWDDEELPRPEDDVAVPELDRELAGEDEEEVVGVRVRVPDELATRLCDLHLAVVVVRDDLRRERLAEGRELVGEVDLLRCR